MTDAPEVAVERLEAELARLREQAKALFRTEAALYQARVEFDHQLGVLAGLQRLAVDLVGCDDVRTIAKDLAALATHRLRFERCAVLLRSSPSEPLRAVGHDGYAGDDLVALRAVALETPSDLGAILRDGNAVAHRVDEPDAALAPVAEKLGMGEALACGILGAAGRIDGLIVAGNSLPGVGAYVSVADAAGRSGLTNVAAVAAALLVAAASRRDLAEERDLLESRVAERTGELSKALDEVTRLSRTDPLTGLLNRRALLEYAALALSLASRHERALGLVLCDIDHFKRVNDTKGQQVGDAALVAVADALRAAVRESDKVGRYGGEEFLVLLTETTEDAPTVVASRCQTLVRQIGRASGGAALAGLSVTASFGVSVFPRDGDDLDTLIQRADHALHTAKARGRDTVVSYHDARAEASTSSRVLVFACAQATSAAYAACIGEGYDVAVTGVLDDALARCERAAFEVVVAEESALGAAEFLAFARARLPDAVQLVCVGGGAELNTTAAIQADGFVLQDDMASQLRPAIEECPRASSMRTASSASPRARPQAAMTRELDALLASDGVRLAWQPIVDATTGAVVAYEGLCRVQHRVFKQPQLLFEVAIHSGRIRQLARRVRAVAIAAQRQLPPGALLFLNMHPAELDDPELLETLAFDARERVVVEVTEAARVAGTETLRRRIAELRAEGFRVAVDDLGAGYASLNSVALLEPEFLKIDMTLIRGIHRSPAKARLVRSIVEFARDQGTTVVAEGIETEEEAACVRALGCPWGQGYLFGRPAALTDAAPWTPPGSR